MTDTRREARETVAGMLREIAGLSDQVERLTMERDALLEGCVLSTWRNPDHYIESGHGWEWRFGSAEGFVATREQAIAAVRGAAGLPPAPSQKEKP